MRYLSDLLSKSTDPFPIQILEGIEFFFLNINCKGPPTFISLGFQMMIFYIWFVLFFKKLFKEGSLNSKC